ncbi:MAG: SDR family oxidoreductase [Candidatus Tectomicrobia bacterium]|uniref:SDR family oxidoreductase n=1 Tax=Tectimicrobiota bacterium TaxID=2528274 RepID=A0A937W522_UNCTE|nr:SDR family oxidoreductase [Candidatus Tectomicrobia bacterium]
MLLEGKVAVVTGGGNGIGREICKLMGAEGAKVVVNDLGTAVDGIGQSSSAADQTVDLIKQAGGEATANYDSVATPEGGQNIIQTAINAYGRIDILVHVAGILRDRMIFNMSVEEWDAVINVHLRGAFCVNKPACVLMRAQKSGSIINFSSISGAGNSGQANYSAAKAGILGLTRTVARDMAKYGVRANAIWPGANTRMTATVPESARQIRSERGLGEIRTSQIERKPEHVASVVAFLASDMAQDITGWTVGISGDRLSLIDDPKPVKTIFCEGGWTLDKVVELWPGAFGLDLRHLQRPEQ